MQAKKEEPKKEEPKKDEKKDTKDAKAADVCYLNYI